MRNQLILFEGIPGSGKTTTSKLLWEHLARAGMEADYYPEGIEHPVDLPYRAYLTADEYAALRSEYPMHRAHFDAHAIVERKYALVPYRRADTPADAALTAHLAAREFCYSDHPAVPFGAFCAVFRKRFADFAARTLEGGRAVILESTLFQHQLHDMNRLYPELSDAEILQHILSLAEVLAPLNPILFYLSQADVAEALTRIARLRGKPRYALPETIAYYERRKRLELAALERLPFEARVLNNTARDWDAVMGEIGRALSPS